MTINWAAESRLEGRYEIMHSAKGLVISLFATALITTLVLSTGGAFSTLPRVYRICTQVMTPVALFMLIFALGKTGFSKHLLRREGLALRRYLERGEYFSLSLEEGGARFSDGTQKVSIPLLRMRRNFGVLIFLIFSIAVLALTGGILAADKKSLVAHLSYSGMLITSITLNLLVLLLTAFNFYLGKKRIRGSVYPLQNLIVQVLHEIANAAARPRGGAIGPSSAPLEISESDQKQDDEDQVKCFDQYLSIIKSDFFSTTHFSSSDWNSMYASWDFLQERLVEVLPHVQKNTSFQLMHCLSTAYQNKPHWFIKVPNVIQSLFEHYIASGTFLESFCIISVAGSMHHEQIVIMRERYQKKVAKKEEWLALGRELAIVSMPEDVCRTIAEYLLPNLDLLPIEDASWLARITEQEL